MDDRLVYIVWYPVDEDAGECSGIDRVWKTRELAEAYATLKGYPEGSITEWAVWDRLA